MSMNIDKKKLLKRTIIILLLLMVVGIFAAHKFVQRYGFEGIGEFISVYSHNKDLADKVVPDQLQITMEEEDYQFLKSRRDKAIERGIQINEGEDNYVPCKLIQNGDTVKGEIRLKGHMTDHLEGDKWSFRIKTKKKPVFGMSRFSLQAPGTRNYAYEWVYHQLLKQENVIHLNYDFIQVKLNEKDLGIYAIEEHFGQHVLDHNDRPAGAILRWNPNLYWEWRIDELQGTYLDEQYSSYASSFVEPYEKGTVEDDSVLIDTYIKGAALLEAFRRGEKKTSEIFDVEKMASFHAVIDLVGGHHSLDWSDVKFFYNSETGKVEPVGYESFSVRKTESVAGQRIPDDYDQLKFNYHDMLFADPIFFEAYIKALERICNETYLDDFKNKIQPELDKKLGVLAHEFPYRKFTFDPYFENIELIRHNLELPKPFHAFKESVIDSMLTISVTPVSDFPIEIYALEIDGKDIVELDSVFCLPAKARNTYAHYFDLNINVSGFDKKDIKNLKLISRIPGSSKNFKSEVSDLPSYNQGMNSFSFDIEKHTGTELTNLNDTAYFFNAKDVVINGTIYLADTLSTLYFFPGQTLKFEENGKIVLNGNLRMAGGSEEGEEILVTCGPADTDAGQNNEYFYLQRAKALFDHVEFVNSNNLFWISESELFFQNCVFADTDSALLKSTSSEVCIFNCASGSLGTLGIFDRSLVRIKNLTAKNGNILLYAYGTDLDIADSDISGYNKIASLNFNSGLLTWQSEYAASEVIAELNDASFWKSIGGNVSGAKVGFKLDTKSALNGESVYELYKSSVIDIETISDKK
ncbi:MAG: CotH kinase family protein [Crocinitomicaceae bacterium]|nr:CotH kinase family protein [Crocinitomicaceae bacterium]